MASTSSSLVLGCAYGLRPKAFEPFVHSLRATGYKGRLGLVLGYYETPEIRELASLADFWVSATNGYEEVNTLVVRALGAARARTRLRNAYPFMFKAASAAGRRRRRPARWRALEFRLEGLMALRHLYYYDIVRSAGADVDQVLLCDLRDVIFQGDPFEPPVRQLEVFLEDSCHTIAREPWNRASITTLYGAGELAAIGEEVASCAGTVIGRRDHILHYLREMAGEMTERRLPVGEFDQGIHNHLLRRGRLRDATIVENGSGRVLTMADMSCIERGEDGSILNRDGSRPAVLHQYDRYPSLAAELVAGLGLAR